MTPHVHAPSRRLPCGCTVKPGEVTEGATLTRRCAHATWTGTVHAAAVVAGLLLIDWARR